MMGMSTSQAEQDAAIALLTILKDPAAAKDNLQKLLDAQAIAIAQGQSAAEAKKAADAAMVNLDAQRAEHDTEMRAREKDVEIAAGRVAAREAALSLRERLADVRHVALTEREAASKDDIASRQAAHDAEIKDACAKHDAFVSDATSKIEARTRDLDAREKTVADREATIAKREAAAIAAAAKREAAAKAAQEAADELQAKLQDRLTALKSAIAD